MAKDVIWNIRVDGTRHEICLKDRGNSFNVYVDGDFRYQIRSDINLDIEEDLTVGTKRCRVCVYRGVPDLAVDGILINADEKIRKEDRRNRILAILAGILMLILGTTAAWAWTFIYASGQTHFGGLMGPVFAAAMFAAGVWLIVRTIRKKGY